MTGVPPESWAIDPTAASAYEVAPSVWRLRLPSAWPHIGHVNAYALRHSESGLVLVDCGQGGHPTGLEALTVALKAAGHELVDVRDLVVTHYDTDHMGNLGAVKAASDCVVWAHRRCEAFLEVVEQPDQAEQRRRSMAIAGGANDELVESVASVREEVEGADAPVRPDRLLKDGVILDTATGGWRVVELPGHSPSQVGLWQEDQRMLISGDVMVPTFSALGDAEGSDDPIEEWRTSIERVRALDARVAFPGHGRPITDVSALTDDYLTGFTQHLDATDILLNHEPLATAAVMNLRYPDMDASLAVWRYLETQNLLTHLATQRRAIRTIGDSGHITWTRSQHQTRAISDRHPRPANQETPRPS
jgi:glyoxylase-like metal-dependent hydrolase (beta-lactamase superfamily II)